MAEGAPLRVLHVLTSDHRRGAETSAVEIAELLGERGHLTRTVALSGSGTTNALPVQVLPGRGRLPLVALRALRREARRADVVLAHGSATLPACALALVGPGMPPFVYANIGDPLFWASTRARRLRVRLFLRQAARIAALSPRSASTLAEHLGVPRDRLDVVPNGRSGDHFRPARPEQRVAARRDLGLPEGARVVACVAALSVEKRIDLLIRAVAELPEVHLLLAGAGPAEAELRRLADDLVPGRVSFCGQLGDVRPVYAAADVVALTSDSEGLPGVLVEAGLSGLPAVATDVGYVADVVIDGRTGALVPAGDDVALAAALDRVLGSSGGMGAEARAHCLEQFEMTDVVARWESVLVSAARAVHRRAAQRRLDRSEDDRDR